MTAPFPVPVPKALSPGRKIPRPFAAKRSALSHECRPSDSALLLPSSPHTPCTSPAPAHSSETWLPAPWAPHLPSLCRSAAPTSSLAPGCVVPHAGVTSLLPACPPFAFSVLQHLCHQCPGLNSLLRYLVWCGFYVLAGPQRRSQNRQLPTAVTTWGHPGTWGHCLPAPQPPRAPREGRPSPQARVGAPSSALHPLVSAVLWEESPMAAACV